MGMMPPPTRRRLRCLGAHLAAVETYSTQPSKEPHPSSSNPFEWGADDFAAMERDRLPIFDQAKLAAVDRCDPRAHTQA